MASGGLAFGLFSGEVGRGGGVVEALGRARGGEGGVDLAVAAGVEAVAVVLPEEAGIGATRRPGELESVAKRSMPAISPIKFGGDERRRSRARRAAAVRLGRRAAASCTRAR